LLGPVADRGVERAAAEQGDEEAAAECGTERGREAEALRGSEDDELEAVLTLVGTSANEGEVLGGTVSLASEAGTLVGRVDEADDERSALGAFL
jgi:hypothetical protein